MKANLLSHCLSWQLIVQSALLVITLAPQRKAIRASQTSPSSSRERVTQEITCAADVNIAECIVKVAKRGGFTTFAKLADRSGLETVLKGAGPYTVFVPTDQAFSAFGLNKVNELLDPVNRERLREVVYLHAIRGNMRMSEVSQRSGSGTTAVSLQGLWLDVAKEGKVNGARILEADIQASNGTIHIIDTVLVPERNEAATASTPPEVVLATPKLQQRTGPRVITVRSWPNEPVKIIAVKLRDGELIKPGVTFQAVDDWVRGLTLTVTNVSNKPVCFIHVQLHLPRGRDDDAGAAANDALMFTCDPVNVPKPYPLMPGLSMELVLTDSEYVAHEALLNRYGYPTSATDLELMVLEVEFFGMKNTKWSKGQMIRIATPK